MPLSPDVLRNYFTVQNAGWQVSMRSMFFGLSSLRSLHVDTKATRAANKPPRWSAHLFSHSPGELLACERILRRASCRSASCSEACQPPLRPTLSPEDAHINSNRNADKRITSNSTWPRREQCLRTQCHQNSDL
jgi:hypothetical protein